MLGEHYISTEEICGSILEGVVITASNGDFLYWSETAKYLLGSDPKKIPPEDWSKEFGLYTSEGDRFLKTCEQPVMKALAGEDFRDYLILCKNMNFPKGVLLSVNGKPLRSSNATVGSINTFRDITTHVESNRNLVNEMNFYKNILDLVPGIVVIKDLKLKIIYANKRFKDLVGESLVEGKQMNDFIGTDIASAIDESDHEIIKNGEFANFKEEIIWKNKKRLVLMTTRFPYRNAEGKIIGVCSIATEVTNNIEPTLKAIRSAGKHTVSLLNKDSTNIGLIKDEMVRINQLIEKLNLDDQSKH
jgi:PAS domain S-box-containing protein